MKKATYNMLLQTASKDNILILTSSCSTSCVFCSHKQNPAEVEAFFAEDITLEQAQSLIEFLNGKKKIIIGESATRICEGEPFKHKHVLEILKMIRMRHRKAVIQITTSGVLLNNDILEQLQKLDKIELNISLNSSSTEGRKMLYSGKPHLSVLKIIESIHKYNISYSGSIVAMPHLLGWEDIRHTIKYLEKHGASTIRIFLSGYTKYTKGVLPNDDIYEELQNFINLIRKDIQVPIILEPSIMIDLKAVIEGIVPNSQAYKGGLKTGDIIEKVNGKSVFSRVDAYYKIYELSNPKIIICRENKSIEIILLKKAKSSAGAVFNYDIHPETIAAIKGALRRHKESSCLLLTSQLAYNIICCCIETTDLFKIEVVQNDYFGGNIKCAGLLTINDLLRHLKQLDKLPEVVLLPPIMFDSSGKDLTGKHYLSISEELEIIVELP